MTGNFGISFLSGLDDESIMCVDDVNVLTHLQISISFLSDASGPPICDLRSRNSPRG